MNIYKVVNGKTQLVEGFVLAENHREALPGAEILAEVPAGGGLAYVDFYVNRHGEITCLTVFFVAVSTKDSL